MKGVIYCYHCIPTGKKYIGKTKNEKIRKRSHRYRTKKGVKNNFYNAVRKYGWENFVYGIVGEFDILLLDEKEIYYIDFYNTYNNGYNSTKGGEGGKTWIMSEEIKEQYRDRMKTFRHTEEAKKKISEANKGRKWNEKSKKNLSEKLKGKKGPVISKEAKKKLSLERKGILRTKEVIEKISKTMKEKYNPEKHISSKKFIFTSPNGEEYIVVGRFKKFCKEQNISYWGMKNIIRTGKMVPSCKNWRVRRGD